MKYKYIFSVVTYRNTLDIIDFLESIKKIDNYKVIIVNNYYDEASEREIQETARKYNCDFIQSENLGYSVGNHKAIEYAKEHYEFEYIIISNPDITVQRFPTDIIENAPMGVLASQIITVSGRNQNPMVAKDNRFACTMLYEGIRDDKKWKFNLGRGINKIISVANRVFSCVLQKKYATIYQAHGSFIIIPREVLLRIGMPFDEKMFLFGEEGVLAWKLREKGISTYYCKDIVVHHKEDGSMKFRHDINTICIESNQYFYEEYYLKDSYRQKGRV